jgi:hypothetical protein
MLRVVPQCLDCLQVFHVPVAGLIYRNETFEECRMLTSKYGGRS